MHMGKMQLSSGVELSSLFEDLHWILMITGHLNLFVTKADDFRIFDCIKKMIKIMKIFFVI